MATMDRRTFVGRTAAFAGAGLFGSAALETLTNRQALGQRGRHRGDEYGPLFPTMDQRTGRLLLALPAGFTYTTFGVIGTTMSDGNITPLALDGMAAFPHPTDPNLVRLIRNHEDRNGTGTNPGPSNLVTPAEAPFIYDPSAGGGCSTLDYDPRTRTHGARLHLAQGHDHQLRRRLQPRLQALAHRRGGGQRAQQPPPRLHLPGAGHARAGRDAERAADHPDGALRARSGDDRPAHRHRLRDRGRGRGLRLRLLPLHAHQPPGPLRRRATAHARHRRAPAGRPAPGPAHRPPAGGHLVPDQHPGHELHQQQPGRERLPPGLRPGRGQVQPPRGHLVGRRGLDLLRLHQRRRRQEPATTARTATARASARSGSTASTAPTRN